MKKLFKFLMWLLAIIVILIVTLYLTAGIWLRTAVSTLVPQMTKTAVSLQDSKISLFKGELSFKGFKIANPDGFSAPTAFELAEVSVGFEPMSLLSEKIVINNIKVDGVKVNAEFAQNGNLNLLLLKQNIQSYFGAPVTTQAVASERPNTPKDSSGKSVVVKNLDIVNSAVGITVLNNTKNLVLPDVHQKNIGENKKVDIAMVVDDIFSSLTNSSLQEIAKSGNEAVGSVLNDLVKRTKAAEPVRDLLQQSGLF